MKRLSAIVILTLLVIPTYGQVINGKVIDSSNSKPLVYVNIGVVGTPIGTITDENGNFSIDVTGQPLNANVRFSMIAYKPKTFTIEALSKKDNTVKLIPDTMHLKEVVVRPSGKIKDVGSIIANYTEDVYGWYSTDHGKGCEIGLKIPLDTIPVKALKLHFKLFCQAFDTAILRLHIRSIAQKKPAEELLTSNILIAVPKNTGVVDFDLSKYNIVFKGDVAVLLEWVKVVIVNKDKPIDKGPAGVYFRLNKKGPGYFRLGSEMRWIQTGKSPCIYLTVQELNGSL
jgi:hypothetical protein